MAALSPAALGDYLPIVDISAAVADQNKRITITALHNSVPNGLVGAPGLCFEADPNTGMYRIGADQLAVVTAGAVGISLIANGDAGIGTAAPATRLEVVETETITADAGDGYAGTITLDPGYTAATAKTITRHNYIDVNNVSVAGAGPAAVTNAAVLRFDANIGTHEALAAAFQTTDSNAETTDWAGGIIVNVNGTLYKIPIIAL